MPSRRTFLHGCLTAALALVAGCTADETAPRSSPTDAPEPTPGPVPTEPGVATDATPTEIGRTTPREPVGTGRTPADVVLSNEDDHPHEIGVAIRERDAGEPHYDQSVTLDAGGRYRMDPFSEDARGTHVLRFRLVEGTAQERYEWDLSEQSEDGWLSVGVTKERRFVVQYAMA